MGKTYADYADEISSSELYRGLLAFGLFSEKLPPVFQSESFYKYSMNIQHCYDKQWHKYIYYESMRDTNVPRALGIPNPMAYERLCKVLADNWDKICKYFHRKTDSDPYKKSLTHIRKLKGTESLFEMNYSNWMDDGSPIPDILLGKKFVVEADISACFPSMYTHALTWALCGKDFAKTNRGNAWYNDIDYYSRNINDGESHGFLIGPHASNLLSEIILTSVDKELSDKGYDFVRHIDDYNCYVETYEKAQCFITDLNRELKKFNLTINLKKTKIGALPEAETTSWVRRLNEVSFLAPYGGVSYKTARAYLDTAIQLTEIEGNSEAVLKYAIKVLSDQKVSSNAKAYCTKVILHLAYIYPYLIPILDEFVFIPYKVSNETIQRFSQMVFEDALKNNNYEAATYSIYFAIKYNFKIENISAQAILEKNDCMLDTLAWLYFLRLKDLDEIEVLTKKARELKDNYMDEYWLFVYEALSSNDLIGEWKAMKDNDVSFVKPEFR